MNFPMTRRQFAVGLATATGIAGGLGSMSGTSVADPGGPIVRTAEGLLRGASTMNLNVFRGIRYGEDTALTRFSPPVPVRSWGGVREAAELGSPCLQTNPDTAPWQDPQEPSEDCLFLNVWAPQGKSSLPVMVWIHGGAYDWGSGGAPMYDGAALAARGDVVVVTVNHRLNVFGYVYLGELSQRFADSANLGQLDLVEALGWVNRNIAAFGGDPANVTIFGESGGGGKIGSLLGMPSAQGLFAKAILQSGTQMRLQSQTQTGEVANALLDRLALSAEDADGLRTVDAVRLQEAYESIVAENTGLAGNFYLSNSPVQHNATMPYQLDTPDARALWADKPMLIGITEEETAYFALEGDRVPVPVDDTQLIERMQVLFPDLTFTKANELLTAYREVLPGSDRSRLLVAITTGHWIWGAVTRQATWKATQDNAVPAFVYIFGWKDPFAGERWAVHGEEVGFVFDHFEVADYLEAGVDTAALRASVDSGGGRFDLRDATMDAWLSFARDGRPSSPLLPAWPAYSTDHRSVMRLDAVSRVWDDPWGPHVRQLLTAP